MVAGPVRARWASSSAALAGRWTARRGREARAEALHRLAGDLRATLVVAFTGARRNGGHALTEVLETTDAPGAVALLSAPDAAAGQAVPVDRAVIVAPTPEQSAADWALAGVQAVRRLADSTDRKVARPAGRLLAAIGDDGAGTLFALAAAGLGAAAVALTGVLGTQVAHDAVGQLRDDLADRAAEQARAAAGPTLAVLASPDLADDATSALGLRLAVLKGLR
jgi:hypothetical protein